MRNRIIVSIIVMAAMLDFSSAALAQVKSIPPPPGWGNCPRCQNNADRAKTWVDYKVDGHPFNPKDLSGIWGYAGIANAFDQKTMPPLTEWHRTLGRLLCSFGLRRFQRFRLSAGCRS
jgi:hypothetical protein